MIEFNDILDNEGDGTLRQYQTEAKKAVYKTWIDYNSVLLQMPTGTGKTRIFTSIVRDIHNHSIRIKKALNVLILVHRQELVRQASQTLRFKYKIAHGRIVSTFPTEKLYPTQIASVQTLIRRLNIWTDKDFDIIIVDEAHHSLATSYVKIFKAFPKAKILGVTATPYRLNGEGFDKLFNRLLRTKSISEFIRDGHLCNYRYFSIKPTSFVKQQIDAIENLDINGDYSIQSMMRVFSKSRIRANIVASYKRHALGLKGIVYTINKYHNLQVCEDYRKAGFISAAIDSDTKPEIRQSIITKFKNSEIDILCNVNIFTEGFDCPDIEFIQLARPTKSLSLYLQQVGRGLRTDENKESVVIIDNVGLYNDFGLPSINRDWNKYFYGTVNSNYRELESKSDEGVLKFIDDIEEGNEVTILIDGENRFDYYIIDRFSMLQGSPFYYDDILEIYDDDEEDGSFGYKCVTDLSLVQEDGKFNLVHIESNVPLFSSWFDEIDKPNALGFSKVVSDNRYGIIDLSNYVQTLNCEFNSLKCLDYINRFNDYIVENNNSFGIVNDKGQVVVPVQYESIYPTKVFDNVLLSKKDGWKIFERDEGIVVEYDKLKKTKNFTIICYKSHYGILSHNEEILIHPCIYNSFVQKGGFYLVGMNVGWKNIYGVLNNQLETIIPIRYENVSFLTDKYIKYHDDYEDEGIYVRGFGVFDTNGEEILQPKYQDISIHDNLFVLRIDNEWRVVNSMDEVISRANKRSIAIEQYESQKCKLNKKIKRPRIKRKLYDQ